MRRKDVRSMADIIFSSDIFDEENGINALAAEGTHLLRKDEKRAHISYDFTGCTVRISAVGIFLRLPRSILGYISFGG